jgi:hypothetical protein
METDCNLWLLLSWAVLLQSAARRHHSAAITRVEAGGMSHTQLAVLAIGLQGAAAVLRAGWLVAARALTHAAAADAAELGLLLLARRIGCVADEGCCMCLPLTYDELAAGIKMALCIPVGCSSSGTADACNMHWLSSTQPCRSAHALRSTRNVTDKKTK